MVSSAPDNSEYIVVFQFETYHSEPQDAMIVLVHRGKTENSNVIIEDWTEIRLDLLP